jgi:hypothetical protein
MRQTVTAVVRPIVGTGDHRRQAAVRNAPALKRASAITITNPVRWRQRTDAGV